MESQLTIKYPGLHLFSLISLIKSSQKEDAQQTRSDFQFNRPSRGSITIQNPDGCEPKGMEVNITQTS